MMGWQWHQLDDMQIICTSLQTDRHHSVFTGWMLFLPPNQQCQSTEGNFCSIYVYTKYHTTVLWPFFQDYPGESVLEEKLLDFMAQGEINRGRHTDHPPGRHSIRTNQCPPPPSPVFYRPDALPAAQPTVSKHWRQL